MTSGPARPRLSTSSRTAAVSPWSAEATASFRGSTRRMRSAMRPSPPVVAATAASGGPDRSSASGNVQLLGLDLALSVGAGVDRAGSADLIADPGQRVGTELTLDVDDADSRTGDALVRE